MSIKLFKTKCLKNKFYTLLYKVIGINNTKSLTFRLIY